jgi:glycosyltransferase involved in cell wall biosynthesis
LIRENYHGLPVYRAFNLDIGRKGPVLRGIDQLVGAFSFWLTGAVLPPVDIVLAYSPPLPLALAALALGRQRRVPVVVNVQDLFPQSAIDLQVMKNSLLIALWRRLESLLYRRADRFVVHSRGNRDYLAARGARAANIAVIPNWVDVEAIKPGPGRNPWRRRLRGSAGGAPFIVSFAGIMGYSQDLDCVLKSAGLLKGYKDIRFVLVGDGVERPRLVRLARERGLDNVQFLPMQPREEYAQALAASDLCLVTLHQAVQTPVVPSKILSIMAAGRPLVASLPPGGDGPRLIREARCGVCLPPGDPGAMAQAVLGLYGNAAARRKMGANGRRFAVEHLSLQKCAGEVEALLVDTVSRGRRPAAEERQLSSLAI